MEQLSHTQLRLPQVEELNHTLITPIRPQEVTLTPMLLELELMDKPFHTLKFHLQAQFHHPLHSHQMERPTSIHMTELHMEDLRLLALLLQLLMEE
jgi:hypothetical protein